MIDDDVLKKLFGEKCNELLTRSEAMEVFGSFIKMLPDGAKKNLLQRAVLCKRYNQLRENNNKTRTMSILSRRTGKVPSTIWRGCKTC